jgi:8-oxo-dGTP diphosphatase
MIRVTCAIIRNEENEILIVQRGEKTDHPLKWEFPGGKIAGGESEEECIIREINEELSMEIVICRKLNHIEYDYGFKKVHLIPFICDTLDELPTLSEHVAFKWSDPKDLLKVDFSEADVIVAREYLDGLIGIESLREKHMKEELLPVYDAELQSMVNNMLSMKEVEWVATSAIENPAIFNKLFEYSFSSDKKLAFRASWTLSKVCDKYPEMIYPYLTRIIEKLDKLDNESSQRSFLRIISFTDIERINQKLHGILTDHCFRALNSGFSAIAIKAYSMEILYKLAVKYPELANELSASVNILQSEGSAGIAARGRMILKKLAEITSDRGSSR